MATSERLRTIGSVLWLLVLAPFIVRGDNPPFDKMTDEQLIDSLQQIRDETVGIDSMAVADAFIAEDKPPKFSMGVLGTKEPASYPQMRLLVQHGVKALPALLKHIDDPRPTQLSVPPPKSSSCGARWVMSTIPG
jgi:hypothetical protein